MQIVINDQYIKQWCNAAPETPVDIAYTNWMYNYPYQYSRKISFGLWLLSAFEAQIKDSKCG